MGGYETSMPQMGYLASMLFKSYYSLTHVWDGMIYHVHLATCAVRLIGAWQLLASNNDNSKTVQELTLILAQN